MRQIKRPLSSHAYRLLRLLALVCLMPALACPPAVHAAESPDQPAASPFRGNVLYLGGARLKDKEQAVTAFDHARHARDFACAACHRDAETEKKGGLAAFRNFAGVTLTDRAARKNAFHDACASCHARRSSSTGRGPALAQCRACHSVTDAALLPKGVYKPAFNASLHERHLMTDEFPATPDPALPASAIAAENFQERCIRCHHAPRHDPNLPARTDSCRACHTSGPGTGTSAAAIRPDAGSPNAASPAASMRDAGHKNCLSCHAENAARKKAHGPLQCAGCHDKARFEALPEMTRNPSILTMDRPAGVVLSDTPKPQSVPLAPLYPPGKRRISTMKAVPFNHSLHEQALNCRDCHHTSVRQSCVACHTAYGDPQGNKIPLSQAMHSITSRFSCVSCHTRASAAAPECAGCHTPRPIKDSGQNCAFCHRAELGAEKRDALLASFNLPQANVEQAGQQEARTASAQQEPGLAAPPSVPDEQPQEVRIDALSREFRPVSFAHQKHLGGLRDAIKRRAPGMIGLHGKNGKECAACHHRSPRLEPGMTPPPCISCHPANMPTGVTAMPDGRPLLKAAYHMRCMDCHTRMQREQPAANDCLSCHVRRQPGEAPVW